MITARFISARTEKALQDALLRLAVSKDKGYQIINIYQRKDGMFVAWYYLTINEAIKDAYKEVKMSKPINSIEDGYLGSLRREEDGRHLVAVTLEKILGSKLFESYSPVNQYEQVSVPLKNLETLAITKVIPPGFRFFCTGLYVSGDNRGIARLKKNAQTFVQGRTWYTDFSKRVDAAIILNAGDTLTVTIESPSDNGVFDLTLLGWEYES